MNLTVKRQREAQDLYAQDVARASQLKVLDLVSVFATHCESSAALVPLAECMSKFLIEEAKFVVGSKKYRLKTRKTGRTAPKRADMLTKVRVLLTNLVEGKPAVAPGEEERFAEAAYATLEVCTTPLGGSLGILAATIRTDLFLLAVWSAGTLLKTPGVEIDSERIKKAFEVLLGDPDVSHKMTDAMQMSVDRFHSRFTTVFSDYVAPVLAEEISKPAKRHPHTRLLLLKGFFGMVRLLTRRTMYRLHIHDKLLRSVALLLKRLPCDAINMPTITLVLNLACVAARRDRSRIIMKHSGSFLTNMLERARSDGTFATKAKRRLMKFAGYVRQSSEAAFLKDQVPEISHKLTKQEREEKDAKKKEKREAARKTATGRAKKGTKGLKGKRIAGSAPLNPAGKGGTKRKRAEAGTAVQPEVQQKRRKTISEVKLRNRAMSKRKPKVQKSEVPK
eukprot:NODE_765_length_1920_cov_45.933191_g709_i0.p1 GENE.NODE_765_length_1920_cov_45.933191_g709_i0~~NODE_765_length_1920_cov_45.933191_g709_i0.p1  ORF type:complete len:527 (-),score=100.03 NODE_765_length_1920_cov_45.933191_g709_i0:340-1686(-)